MTATEVNTVRLAEYMRNRPKVPAGKSGEVEIVFETIRKGQYVDVVSLRNALLMGQKPTRVCFDETLRTRRLRAERGTWMTDHPQEVWQMDEPIQRAHGDVLIGGLGLGVVSHLIARKQNVNQVVTVEKDKRIEALVSQYVHWKNTTVIADLRKFVKKVKPGQFDFAFLDTWQGTGEHTWWVWVVPMRRALRGKIPEVHCWNEEEMRGQLRMGLPVRTRMGSDAILKKLTDSNAYQGVFARAAKRRGIGSNGKQVDMAKPETLLPAMAEATTDPEVTTYIEKFLDVSSDEWESEFGDLWDKLVPKQTKE